MAGGAQWGNIYLGLGALIVATAGLVTLPKATVRRFAQFIVGVVYPDEKIYKKVFVEGAVAAHAVTQEKYSSMIFRAKVARGMALKRQAVYGLTSIDNYYAPITMVAVIDEILEPKN